MTERECPSDLQKFRNGYLAGATAYARECGHSCLMSDNEVLRRVRDQMKPPIGGEAHEPERKTKCPICVIYDVELAKDGMHRCSHCEGYWRPDELIRPTATLPEKPP